jgi:hypothetical protein
MPITLFCFLTEDRLFEELRSQTRNFFRHHFFERKAERVLNHQQTQPYTSEPLSITKFWTVRHTPKSKTVLLPPSIPNLSGETNRQTVYNSAEAEDKRHLPYLFSISDSHGRPPDRGEGDRSPQIPTWNMALNFCTGRGRLDKTELLEEPSFLTWRNQSWIHLICLLMKMQSSRNSLFESLFWNPLHFHRAKSNISAFLEGHRRIRDLRSAQGVSSTHEHLGPGMELDSGSSNAMEMGSADAEWLIRNSQELNGESTRSDFLRNYRLCPDV